MALNRRFLGCAALLTLLLASAPALAQDDAGVDGSADAGAADAGGDAGPDPCFDACGPDLRCIVIDDGGFCGQCAPGETQDCAGCPGATQECGGDLYWELCECPGCGDGPACGRGLECIVVDGFYYCGICAPGDARDCNTGCGEGVETCESDLFWGRCVPTDPVDCVPGDRLECASECGPGHMECDGASCEWSGQCVPDALIQCLPGATTDCTVIGACLGTQTCGDACAWGACVPPPDGCHECGDGVLDDGESCDDENLVDGDGCSSGCEWEDARPFRSCECRMAAGLPASLGDGAAAIGLLAVAIGLIRRRPVR
jgi:cysteine-rich repeat protein